MEELTRIWGIHENVTPLEIAARSFVMFFIALLLIRVSGLRAFGRSSAFDNVITFLIGGILSRGVVGATPFLSCITGAFVILMIYRILGLVAMDNKLIGKWVKGEKYLLYKNGNFVKENMTKTGITEHDMMEKLRIQVQLNNLAEVEEVNMERNGEISFVKKKNE